MVREHPWMLDVWRRTFPPLRLFRTHHGANPRTGLAYLAQHEAVEQLVPVYLCKYRDASSPDRRVRGGGPLVWHWDWNFHPRRRVRGRSHRSNQHIDVPIASSSWWW